MQSLKLCLNIKNIQIGKNNVIIKKNKVRKIVNEVLNSEMVYRFYEAKTLIR